MTYYPTVHIKHACGHQATYPAPINDDNGEIATGMAAQSCWQCADADGDWMDAKRRAQAQREAREARR